MSRLDDIDAIKALDRSNMLQSIRDLPDQIETAWKQAKKLTLPSNYIQAKNIVLLGMGGSAIGGDLAAALVTSESEVPIIVVRDYTLPRFVHKESLVIAVSYSGNTEETVTALEAAGKRGAKIITISTDGEIETIGSRYRAQHFKISYGAQPRAALGYLFAPILSIFSRIGIVEVDDKDVERAVASMRRIYALSSPELQTEKNPIKQLAGRMRERIPIVIGVGTLSPVARRFKTQLNENAKLASHFEVLPEWDHNSIVGFRYPTNLGNILFYLVLKSKFDHPRNNLRSSLLVSHLAKHRTPVEVISFPETESPLEEQVTCILFGDLLSFYLAVLNGVDPTPVPAIEELKDKLKR